MFSKVVVALALSTGFAAEKEEMGDCMDSKTWHKNGEDWKNCEWVGKFAEKRCMVKGAVDKMLAKEACPKACGMCEEKKPSLREQMCIPMFDAPVKPDCVDAIEQSPADITKGAVGMREPSGVLTEVYEAEGKCVSNVHWHLGAEHMNKGTFDVPGTEWLAENGKSDPGDVQPGFFCQGYDDTDPKMTTEYDWQYCVNMHVGYTYEVHWPHSSAAPCGLYSDGLAGLFCESHTPSHVGVQGQVFVVVNDPDTDEYDMPRMIEGMHVDETSDIAKYTGSSTGQSHNNEVCSPYAGISWHVDRACHMVSAKSFDEMCKVMKIVYGMKGDLYPHGSRELVDPEFVSNIPMA